jgi:putative flippase GtrA
MILWIEKMWGKYKDIFWYCFFGGLTTVVNIVIFYIFSDLINLHYMIANVIAWIVAVLFAYITNRTWVFKSKIKGFSAVLKECLIFTGFRVLSLGMEMVILFLMIDLLGIKVMITKLVAQVVVIVANYVFSKWIIFKEPNKQEKNRNEV